MTDRIDRAVDHLVLATTDVDATAAWLADATGVAPSPGGSHVGFGTRNVLCALGGDVYLEIVGPDRDQGEVARPRPFGIDALTKAGIATWCVRSPSLPECRQRAASVGLVYEDPLPMQRRIPGHLLSWDLLLPDFANDGGVLPFFIDWGDTPHPTGSLPDGLQLTAFAATHPDPDRIARSLAALGLSLDVSQGLAALAVTVRGPQGEVALRSAQFGSDEAGV